MSSQHEVSLQNTSPSRTRQSQGILTSVSGSEDSSNGNDTQLFRGKKRKRNEDSLEDLLKDTFVVRVSLLPLVLINAIHN